MSRLSSYLASAKLAKLHILGADEYSRKEQRLNFEHNVIHALENLLSAMNNVASIGFNRRPRKARASRKVVA